MENIIVNQNDAAEIRGIVVVQQIEVAQTIVRTQMEFRMNAYEDTLVLATYHNNVLQNCCNLVPSYIEDDQKFIYDMLDACGVVL